jgi:tetratricopeptide (TPR) repeat protein
VADELGHPLAVTEFPQATAHLLEIVTACRDCSGGLVALLNALELIEPGAKAVLAARQIIAQMPVDSPNFALAPFFSRTQDDDPVSRPHVWGAIPLRNPDFVGRDDLLELLRARLMEPGATAVLPETLHGLGGVGKSQTVVEYIYRHAAEYDLIWWIPAAQVSQVTNSFVELARQLGLPVESAETAVRLVVDSLRKRRPPLRRWLLVFDNAEAPDEVTPFFPPSGHIVVTSRNPQWAGVARTVEVEVFSRQESIELLRRRGDDIDERDADRLAEALGDLPLAVEHAAAWRAQTGMPVPEYLHLLDRHMADLFTSHRDAVRYQRPMGAVWGVSLRRLGSESPAALQLLQLSAFFGPEPISRSLFVDAGKASIPAAFAEVLQDPIALNRAIGELSRYSLAKVDPRGNVIHVHRLVQSAVRSELAEQQRSELQHCVHVLLANADPGEPGFPWTWPRYAELLAHATNAKVSYCARPDEPIRRFLLNLGRYLLSCGDYASAYEFARKTSDAWQQHLGETNPDTLAMFRRCGAALRRLGRSQEAQELNQHIYDLVLRTFGEDHELFLEVADTRRADQRTLGLFTDEMKSQQDVFERSRRLLGDDHPATLKYANNFASCLRLNGEFEQARRLDEDTLARKKVILGDDHPSTYQSANALAIDLRESGAWPAAAELFARTIEMQCATIGEGHPATVGAMRNLSVVKRLAGRYVEARRLSETCVQHYRRMGGDESVDTITARLGLSADLRRLGDLAESRKLGELCHGLFVRTRGEDHPYTLVAANNLGITLRLAGELHAAQDMNRETLARLRMVFNDNHPFVLASATNLASDLAASGDLRAATEMGTQVLERSGAVLGPGHPSTLAAAANLVADLAQLDDPEKADALRGNTVDALRLAVGEEHPMLAAARSLVRIDCETDTMQL